jgi:hypothetical protein
LTFQRIEPLKRDTTGFQSDVLWPERRKSLGKGVGVHELLDCQSAAKQSRRGRALASTVGPTEHDHVRRDVPNHATTGPRPSATTLMGSA